MAFPCALLPDGWFPNDSRGSSGSGQARRAVRAEARQEELEFGAHLLRRWLIAEGRWLEDHYPGRLPLLKAADDATDRIQLTRFVPLETRAAHRRLLLDYLSPHGRPLAFYTDKAACFVQTTRPYTPSVPLEEREAKATESLLRSALKALNVERSLVGNTVLGYKMIIT